MPRSESGNLSGEARIARVLSTQPESLAKFLRIVDNKSVADVAKSSGLSPDRVERLERRDGFERDGEAEKLAAALRCDPAEVCAPPTRARIDSVLRGLI